MKKFLFLFLILSTPVLGQKRLNEVLHSLDTLIQKRDYYNNKREFRINSLKELLAEATDDENIYNLYRSIAREYIPYTSDSALLYSSKSIETAVKLNDESKIINSQLQLARIYIIKGMYCEANSLLNDISRRRLTKKQRIAYLQNRVELNRYKEVSFSKLKTLPDYSKLRAAFQDSLLMIIDKNTPRYYATKADRLMDAGNYEKMKEVMLESLSKQKIEDRSYGYSAYTLAMAYGRLGDFDNKAYYLAKSAMSDILNGVRENASLRELAFLLFKSGDLKRAYKYIKIAMEDALFSKAKLRRYEVLQILPLIDREYNDMRNKMSRNMLIFELVMSFMIIILFVALIYILKQKKKLEAANNKNEHINRQLIELNEKLRKSNEDVLTANKKLESFTNAQKEYIVHYLKLSSEYIGKIDDFRKSLYKKAISENKDDIIKDLRSKEFINTELKLFYEDFDKAFLDLYPNFIEQFNDLLKDDEKIVLKQDELLNSELRVFALIRLGITESEQIAKFLRYSVTTIYNYRVKMRNKAKIPRDEFKEAVKRIGK
ncbi:MAG: hypothetical protein GXO47_01910 [Chlorobi bacterium]|nr:hypothetical protein [Chlorobiota bacterium]